MMKKIKTRLKLPKRLILIQFFIFFQDEVEAKERIIPTSQNFEVKTKYNFKLLKVKKTGNNKKTSMKTFAK